MVRARSIIFLLLLIASSTVYGQSRQRITSVVKPSARQELTFQITSSSASLPFTVSMPTTRQEFNDDAQHTFIGTIVNNTDSILSLGFVRTQKLPNESWSSSVCFGPTCFPPFTSSAQAAFNPHESKELIVDINSVMESSPDSLIVKLLLFAADANSQDTTSVVLTSVFRPENGVSTRSALAGSATIDRAWPNPGTGGSLNLQVTSSTAGVAFLTLYSENGTQISRVALGQLKAGVTTVAASTAGLAPGSYYGRLEVNGELSAPLKLSILR